MHLNLCVQIILLLVTGTSFTYSSECFANYDKYKCKLASKTPYRFIANYNDTPSRYPGCTEKKIWFLIRHGTRYPGKKDVPVMIRKLPELQKIILKNYKLNKTTLKPEDALLFEQWNLSFNKDDTTKLAVEGEYEMIELAERYQSRFSSLLPEVYDNKTYKFKYTATQRSEESAKHFAVGLFGWHGSQNVYYPESEYRDCILRFYKCCTRWRKEVDKNPSAYQEKESFLKSETYLDMLREVSKRIDYEVDHETVRIMYTICAFETAWNRNTESPWCKIFILSEFEVLEFAEDLEYYWIDGYGYQLSYEQACPALRDMFDFFMSEEEQMATIYFSHSGTVLKLLALLGIAKDSVHLTHDSYSSVSYDRTWRTSIIDTFAANIAFVLYDCDGVFSVLFMHQERPVYLPGCPVDMPCPMSVMKELYPDEDEECQFDAMCFINENESGL